MHNLNRRRFLKTIGIAGAASLAGLPALALRDAGLSKVVIIHTNDLHSRLDPYPEDDAEYPGMAGFARIAALINQTRQENPHVLVLDAGDVFQGTPYFNLYGGKPELKLMSKMGYDAVAFGNHEFDNGKDGFLEVLPYADFPFLAANYDFSDTILAGKVKDYTIIHRGDLKIGVYGLGIELDGLVSRNLYGNTVYMDAIAVARDMEEKLHREYGCDLIICLSHLGYKYEDDKVSDTRVAEETRLTHLIIGGHTHTLLDPPAVVKNKSGKAVTIAQAGYGGTYAGRLQVYIDRQANESFVESHTTKLGQMQG